MPLIAGLPAASVRAADTVDVDVPSHGICAGLAASVIFAGTAFMSNVISPYAKLGEVSPGLALRSSVSPSRSRMKRALTVIVPAVAPTRAQRMFGAP